MAIQRSLFFLALMIVHAFAATQTPTPTTTTTSTATLSPTSTATASTTSTSTSSATASATSTSTSTSSATATATPTSTSTSSATATATATSTSTSSATATATQTSTSTGTSTSTVTSTASPTSTKTSTSTATSTVTQTATATGTSTSSSTATATFTTSSTSTPTATGTSTSTSTSTRTSTSSATSTGTTTYTFSSTGSATATGTITSTASNTLTNSPTPTATRTGTATPTTTTTASASQTSTGSATLTTIPTHTATTTQTQTSTGTVTQTPTPTSSLTVSLTDSASPSPSPTTTNTTLTLQDQIIYLLNNTLWDFPLIINAIEVAGNKSLQVPSDIMARGVARASFLASSPAAFSTLVDTFSSFMEKSLATRTYNTEAVSRSFMQSAVLFIAGASNNFTLSNVQLAQVLSLVDSAWRLTLDASIKTSGTNVTSRSKTGCGNSTSETANIALSKSLKFVLHIVSKQLVPLITSSVSPLTRLEYPCFTVDFAQSLPATISNSIGTFQIGADNSKIAAVATIRKNCTALLDSNTCQDVSGSYAFIHFADKTTYNPNVYIDGNLTQAQIVQKLKFGTQQSVPKPVPLTAFSYPGLQMATTTYLCGAIDNNGFTRAGVFSDYLNGKCISAIVGIVSLYDAKVPTHPSYFERSLNKKSTVLGLAIGLGITIPVFFALLFFALCFLGRPAKSTVQTVMFDSSPGVMPTPTSSSFTALPPIFVQS